VTRRGVTLLELLVAAAVLSVVLLGAWATFRQGAHEDADSEALTELLRAEAVLDSLLGGDLDRLIVEPGCRPAGTADAGRRLSFYAARDLHAGAGDVVADPVVYRVAPAEDGASGLWRNDRRVADVRLAAARFDVYPAGERWLVAARFTVLGSAGGWRLPRRPGARWDLCRSYLARADLPGLARWFAPSALIPGD